VPHDPGYSIEILPESLKRFEFPDGETWREQEHEVRFVQA